MLPRAWRLTRATFPDTRGLKRASSAHFSLSYGRASKGGVSVVISKKVAKFAVTRHLLKRRILAILRPFVQEDLVLVVFTRPGTSQVPFPTLKDELVSLLEGILAERN